MKRIITFSESINEAFIQSSKKNNNIIFFGEGIDDPTAFFGTTKNLSSFISKERIIEMPLSENAITESSECGIITNSTQLCSKLEGYLESLFASGRFLEV